MDQAGGAGDDQAVGADGGDGRERVGRQQRVERGPTNRFGGGGGIAHDRIVVGRIQTPWRGAEPDALPPLIPCSCLAAGRRTRVACPPPPGSARLERPVRGRLASSRSTRSRGAVWSARRPVKPEVAGSNPVGTAIRAVDRSGPFGGLPAPPPPGRVAQLAERPPEKRKVTGSTPVPTTSETPAEAGVSARLGLVGRLGRRLRCALCRAVAARRGSGVLRPSSAALARWPAVDLQEQPAVRGLCKGDAAAVVSRQCFGRSCYDLDEAAVPSGTR